MSLATITLDGKKLTFLEQLKESIPLDAGKQVTALLREHATDIIDAYAQNNGIKVSFTLEYIPGKEDGSVEGYQKIQYTPNPTKITDEAVSIIKPGQMEFGFSKLKGFNGRLQTDQFKRETFLHAVSSQAITSLS